MLIINIEIILAIIITIITQAQKLSSFIDAPSPTRSPSFPVSVNTI